MEIFTMKKLRVDISIEKWFDKVYQHVTDAILSRTGYNQNKSALMPFDLFVGKMVECVWYDRFIWEERYCTEPDFKLYSNNSDGGVDFVIGNSIKVSVKCRSLEHNESAYLDEQLITYNRQAEQATNIINKLKQDNKVCNFIVGAIRYKIESYHDWMLAWNTKDKDKLFQITTDFFNNKMIWFTTEYTNLILEI